MTIGLALKNSEGLLRQAGIASARLDAQILLEQITGQDRSWLLAHSDDELDSRLEASYSKLVEQRADRVPIVHLTGKREFYGLELQITPNVLTPRVETELMVQWAIKYAPNKSSLIDIGTGSGAIAIAIAKSRPDLEIWASEISAEALLVARRNAKKHQVEIKFVQADLWQNIDEKFHTVVTNLPYLKSDADLTAEVKKEPAVALFGGGDGLDLYRRFLTQLPEHLEPGGYLFTECDPWQQPDLIKEATKIGLKLIEQDYFILGFTKL